MPRPLAVIVALALASVLAATVAPWATAAAARQAVAVPTTLAANVPSSGVVDDLVTVSVLLTREDTGVGLAGAEVVLERRVDGAWGEVATVVTDLAGAATATVVVLPSASENRFRASYAGSSDLGASTSEVAEVEPVRRTTRVDLDGPAVLVDERAASLTVRWRTEPGGLPVQGRVTLRRSLAGGPWQREKVVRTDAQGRATLQVRPRVDSRWRAVGEAGRSWLGDASGTLRIDNVPPGHPVAYPSDAPRPRVGLPRQARAVGQGAHPTVSRISNAVWRSMTGRSWHAGCPVGRSGLRVVRVNYWGYDGYRYRGELVVRSAITRKTAGAFAALYRAELPIRAMYRVDRFGWSGRLEGGDNERSMAAGNTSGFNCRGVVGNPEVTSPHSYGRSIDLNTWENPYHSRTGIVPNTWWATHSHPRIAWRSGRHPVVRIMRAHGFRWSYGAQDSQHFDG